VRVRRREIKRGGSRFSGRRGDIYCTIQVMAQEKEIKIQLRGLSLPEFIGRICERGFVFKHSSHQQDLYFDTRDWYLYEHLAALRLRQVENHDYSFSFKKMFYLPQKADKYYIEEIETKAPFTDAKLLTEIFAKVRIPYTGESFTDGNHLSGFLNTHNYFADQHMSKTRQVYVQDDNEIVIDELDRVGTIVELECQTDQPLELVKTLLKPREWTRTLEGTSFAWLRIVKGLNTHTKNLHRFVKQPTWNLWPHEQELYQTILKNK
jgi:adenylate cyclase class IV